jgi:hypothetical protein
MPSHRIDLTLIGLPSGLMSRHRVSDDEARSLYDAWAASPPGEAIVASSDVGAALRAKGLLQARGGGFALTPEGRKVIVEMVTHAPNAFKTSEEMPTYRQIKARAKRREAQSLVKKAARDRRMILVKAANRLREAVRAPLVTQDDIQLFLSEAEAELDTPEEKDAFRREFDEFLQDITEIKDLPSAAEEYESPHAEMELDELVRMRERDITNTTRRLQDMARGTGLAGRLRSFLGRLLPWSRSASARVIVRKAGF